MGPMMNGVIARRVRSFVAVALLCATGIARAEEPLSAESADPQARTEERAKAFFESGLGHYGRGEYRAAVEAFREAQRLWPRPELLYNLAQAERLSGDCRSALTHYREFEATGADLPADLPEKIAEMERCSAPTAVGVDAGAPAAPPPPTPAAAGKTQPASEPEHDDTTFRVLGWASLGGAALSAALGTLFALEANAARNELDEVNRAGGQWNAHYQSLEDSMVRDRNLAIGLFIGAGVLAGTGGWLLLSPPTSSNGNGLAAMAGWRF